MLSSHERPSEGIPLLVWRLLDQRPCLECDTLYETARLLKICVYDFKLLLLLSMSPAWTLSITTWVCYDTPPAST
jgi:hypothetical protein